LRRDAAQCDNPFFVSPGEILNSAEKSMVEITFAVTTLRDRLWAALKSFQKFKAFNPFENQWRR